MQFERNGDAEPRQVGDPANISAVQIVGRDFAQWASCARLNRDNAEANGFIVRNNDVKTNGGGVGYQSLGIHFRSLQWSSPNCTKISEEPAYACENHYGTYWDADAQRYRDRNGRFASDLKGFIFGR